MHCCTIIARNYLAQARVLAESFLEHHPGGTVTVLVLDDPARDIGLGEPFETVRPEDIGLEAREFHHMAMIYTVLELSTAVKPWLLRTLLDRGLDDVTYFDPDILVLAPLDDLSELARRHSIVLTPHTTTPIPHDDRTVTEQAILLAGAFNLGFIAVGARARPFLDWWSERLARHCRVSPADGHFVDQRFVDLVPGLFEHRVLTDPTVNVAYWNAYDRVVEWSGERYEVGGAQLRFYHFSGFELERPWLLSKHQGDAPRVLLSEQPGLARLCEEYAELLRANGYEEWAGASYGLDVLPNGIPVDSRMRRLYRQALLAAERDGRPGPPDPFDPASAEAFLAWLAEPADRSGLSRYLVALREERPDLLASFPDILGPGGPRYLEWAAEKAHAESGVPHELLPRRSGTEPLPPGSEALRAGVNVVGYFSAEAGVGEAARQLVAGFKSAGIPHCAIAYDATPSRQNHAFPNDGPEAAVYDTNVICVNADQFLRFGHDAGPGFFANRYTIGVWWWEVARFPETMHPALTLADEIWVGSDFVRKAIAAETEKPVLTMPLPVEVTAPPSRSRAELGLPEGFVFLFSFDFFSVFERKNPLRLVAAFRRAFAPGEGPTLVIKSINGERCTSALERLRHAARDRPDIRIVNGYLDAEDKNALMASCDCYVSLHRSEGFGLTMAEAMAFGKPVIATGYSGNLDFMNEDTAFLVPYRPTPIPTGCDPYPAGVEWADPDLDEAARLMRLVVEQPEEARARAARGQQAIRRHHSPKRAAAFVSERLAAIRAARANTTPSPEPTPEPRPPSGLERAVAWLERGPDNPWDAPSRLGRLGRFNRRALRRLLRPYESRQRELEVALVDALKEARHEAVWTANVLAQAQAELAALRADRHRLAASVDDARESTLTRVRALNASLGEIRAQLGRRAGDALRRVELLEAHLEGLDPHVHRLQHDLAHLASDFAHLMSHTHARPYLANEALLRTTDSAGREAIGYDHGPGRSDGTYLAFEDIFRGPESFIRERQRCYLELLRSHPPILDVGCGRGELLDLLRDAGVPSRGVDIDLAMIERCRAKGHVVDLADGLEYLAAQPTASLGAIFTAQVIEHLSYESLDGLFGLALDKLMPGGLFVAETVNPHSIRALKTFWVDLTHRAPIFPEVATALCRIHGFASARVVFPNGTGDLDTDLREEGEYAVVAFKGGAHALRGESG